MQRCQTSLCICLLWWKSDYTECCPLACLRASSEAVPHTALPTPSLARKCCGLGYRATLLWQICPGQDLTRSSPRAFVFLFMLLPLLLFIVIFFSLSFSPSCGMSIIRLSQGQPCYMDLSQANFTPLPLPAPSPCLHKGLLAAAFVTETADGTACFCMQV